MDSSSFQTNANDMQSAFKVDQNSIEYKLLQITKEANAYAKTNREEEKRSQGAEGKYYSYVQDRVDQMSRMTASPVVIKTLRFLSKEK